MRYTPRERYFTLQYMLPVRGAPPDPRPCIVNVTQILSNAYQKHENKKKIKFCD